MRVTNHRSMASLAILAALALTTRLALATANYVYHEQTGNDVTSGLASDCGGPQVYVPIAHPASSQSYFFRFKVEFQFDTDTLKIYYTTDGSNPSGSFGIPSGSTQVIDGAYQCTFSFGGNQIDVWNAAIPPQPPGTV